MGEGGTQQTVNEACRFISYRKVYTLALAARRCYTKRFEEDRQTGKFLCELQYAIVVGDIVTSCRIALYSCVLRAFICVGKCNIFLKLSPTDRAKYSAQDSCLRQVDISLEWDSTF